MFAVFVLTMLITGTLTHFFGVNDYAAMMIGLVAAVVITVIFFPYV